MGKQPVVPTTQPTSEPTSLPSSQPTGHSSQPSGPPTGHQLVPSTTPRANVDATVQVATGRNSTEIKTSGNELE